jgi:hypothetical protein
MSDVTATQRLLKQPSEKRKFSMDFSSVLATSETISSITSVTSEKLDGTTSDLTIPAAGESNTISGSSILMWVEGGTHGMSYRVEVKITTSAGQIVEGDGILRVTDT